VAFKDAKPGYLHISNIVKRFVSYSSVPDDVLKNAADRGTRVHEAIDLYIKTGIEDHMLQEQDKPYFESWRKWYEGEVFTGTTKEILHGETRLYDEKRKLTGEFDGIWKRNNEMMLIDWKTSAVHNNLAWCMQGTGYLQLVNMNKFCECSNSVCFLKLSKEAKMAKEYIYLVDDFRHELFNWAVKECSKSVCERIE
jgi:hypothetical protein